MTVEGVNRAAKKYLQTERWEGVMVAGDAEALAAKLESDALSPITHANEMPPDVTTNDRTNQKLPLRPTKVEVVPVASTFEK